MKTVAAFTSLALGLLATSALATPRPLSDAQMSGVVAGANFIVLDEISDTNTEGANPPDPLLVNAWGLSEAPAGGPLWVANNGTGTSTLYDFSSFAKIPLNVTIPGAHGLDGTPTGTVFTSLIGNTFGVSAGGKSGHSLFLFDSEDGTISGWAPSVSKTRAIIAVNQSASGAAFKGLTLGYVAMDDGDRGDGDDQDRGDRGRGDDKHRGDRGGGDDQGRGDRGGGDDQGRGDRGGGDDQGRGDRGGGDDQGDRGDGDRGEGGPPHQARLFAADFTQDRVEVFNGRFHYMGSFTDRSLPPGYAPFNVQALNGRLYVAFALRGGGIDEQDGPGLGFIDVFDMHGHKLSTLVSGGALNAPWGLTIAPASFGKFAGALLVGNFGDGKIHAYNRLTGAFLGTVSSPGGAPVSIDGLWALHNGPDGTVIFSSGPDGEAHGLVGVIQPSWAKASWAFQSHVMLGH